MSGTARLVWEKEDGSSVEFPLAAEIMVVGREPDADIRVDAPLVSRAHARLERRKGRWFVLDLGSTNLTRVNGEVVRERELLDGDEVRFARARCVFRAGEPPPGPRFGDPVAGGV